jgi:hypothetical protein
VNHRFFKFGILVAIVLLLTSALNRNIAFSQVAPVSPDTNWINSHVVEGTSSLSAEGNKSPDGAAENAAILAAQILLFPIEEFLHLPLIIR